MILEDHPELRELSIPDLGITLSGADVDFAGLEQTEHLDVLTFRCTGPKPQLGLSGPLGDAAGIWRPGNNGSTRYLPPDWDGHQSVSLVSSSPVGVLYDQIGTGLFGYAFDLQVAEGTLQYGVSEEWKSFVLHLAIADATGISEIRLALRRRDAAPQRYTQTVAHLRDWLRDGVRGPELARTASCVEPVYSSWYSYSQQIDAETLLAETRIAKQIGCGVLFIDDGWQQFGDGRWYAGCGDWVPDTTKFPDFAGFVEEVHALDVKVVLWVAPLLLGEQADVFGELSRYAPVTTPILRCSILDPRHREVREWVVANMIRMITEYRLDGLKVDFLNDAQCYAGTPSTGDVADVGTAMAVLLEDFNTQLKAHGLDDVLIEFRQPYIGPSTARFANVLRANDCPADAALNRRSVVDVRLLATSPVVHGDPMMWDPQATPTAATRQLLNGFFGVPQISMRLTELSEEHLQATGQTVADWVRHRDLLLNGQLDAGTPADGYPWVTSRQRNRVLLAAYADTVAPFPADADHLVLVNATGTNRIVVESQTETHWSAIGQGDQRVLSCAAGITVIEQPSGTVVEYQRTAN